MLIPTAHCSSLDELMSTVTISYGPDTTPEFDVGTTATYNCTGMGQVLIGQMTRECQDTRTWSGEPPECRCEGYNCFLFVSP